MSRHPKSYRLFARAIRPVIEGLEDRRLLAGDPLQYQNLVQTLPFSLDFTKQQPGVFDSTGQSIGFTRVQANAAGNQYQPSLINLNTTAGELDLTSSGTSTTGTNFGTSNSLVNGLETEFDATTRGFTVTARLKGPLSQISTAYDGGAVYFGPDQDNYVKFNAEYDPAQGGQVLQFTDEQNANTHTVNTYANIGSFANLTTLDLRLTGDALAGTVTASYSVNGGSYTVMPGVVNLTGAEQSAFFNSAGRAGIFVTNHNNLPPITLPFGHFEIDPGQPSSGTVQPTVSVIHPGPSETNVSRDAFVSVDFHLPNGAINPSTLTSNTAYLVRTSDNTPIPSVVTTTGGADAIIVQPKVPLDPNTSYTFYLTSGLQDVTGAPFVPYSETFTTGTSGGTTDPTVAFTKSVQTAAPKALYTDVKIGPDGDLWASTEDGRILQFPIGAGGTLGTPTVYTTLQNFEGGQRLVTGFAFDPASTAANPILWVSNSYYSGGNAYYADNAPDFSGKITVMSGPGLTTVQDAVVNLPRSIRDHGTEQPTFGPDGALYFGQGSNTSAGAPDVIWGNRDEHLLTAAILRLDTTKLNLSAGPLNVMTYDAGGPYNPFAAGAPLTIYADGLRNTFTLLFANGVLYAPTNGASAGGNAPGYPNSVSGTRFDSQNGPYTGPNVQAINGESSAEDDWIFNVQQGGYYGHPDDARAEYVLDGGNPTGGTPTNAAQVADYTTPTPPDRNWRGSLTNLDAYGTPTTFDMGQHHSPDGMIQYTGGTLNGKLLVTEYSGGGDVAVLSTDAAGNITHIERGIAGLTGFTNPISLAETPANGNLYVADIGAMSISLVQPLPAGAKISPSATTLAFNSIATGNSGAGAGHADTLTITNTGTVPLTFPSDGFTILPDPADPNNDAATFAITNRLSIPSMIQPGQSAQVQLSFTANRTGLESAILQIKSNDPASPVTNISLHGLGTTGTGGANEPSFAAILRAFNIPTIVGDGPNDANAYASTFYPNPPDASSQEVPMQRLVKAGSGPVTITPIASFVNINQPASRFGYYVPGDPADRTELFSINKADSQTVNPTAVGSTSFDPGSAAFGLYANFPTFTDNGHQRLSYSEDAFNTWDANVPRKFRFFPLKNPDGSVVPNAYVFAAEDNNIFYAPNIQPYDSNDVVGIIRNVAPAPDAVGAPVLGLENTDGVPGTTRLVFNRIQVLNSDTVVQGDVVHDTDTLTIHNTGDQPLNITGLTLSDTTNWQITSAPTAPIPAGGTGSVTIKFVAQSDPPHTLNETNDYSTQESLSPQAAGGVWNGTLTIASNDPVNPTRVVQLAGYWQHHSEYEEEPGLQTIVNQIYGFGTNISDTQRPQYPNNGKTPVYYGEEIHSNGYFNVADPTLPVTVRQLAAYHNQEYMGYIDTSQVGWYAQGSPSSSHTIFRHQVREGQSLLPNINGSFTNPAFGAFSPSGTFGFNIDGEYTDDSLNTTDINTYGRSGHSARVYPARDAQGNLIPNTWLIGMDYENSAFDNSDFQDNVYLVTNMRPANQPGAPTDLNATAPASGGVALQWAAVAYTGAQYNVYRSTTATGPFVRVNGSPITASSFLDASAPAGSTSYYRVTAVDPASGIESPGAAASATALSTLVSAPAAPAQLAATPSVNGIALQWNANTETNLAGYLVYRSTSPSGPFKLLTPSLLTTPTYNDTSATAGVVSYYQVFAVNTSNIASTASAVSTTRPVNNVPATSVFPSTSAPAPNLQNVYDSTIAGYGGVELGMKFRSDTAGTITGVRFWKGSQNTGTHTGELWSSTGQLLATATFTNETASGWQQVNFASPVSIAANTTYVVSYQSTSSYLAYTAQTFATAGVDNNQLHGLQTGVDGPNGVYGNDTTPGTAIFPTLYNNQAPNYWVDVVYAPAATATAPSAPTNLAAAANSPTQVALTWTASTGTVTAYHVERSTDGVNFTEIAGNVQGTTYTDTTALANTAYTYRVRAENSGSFSGYSNTQQVTTPAATAATSIFPSTLSPASSQQNVNDPTITAKGGVELGLKFRSDTAGTITGVRFWKGSQNIGTHTGELWSSTGQLLATATFTGETASGWQQVSFSSPVSIAANTTYIVAYHTTAPYIAYTGGKFTSAGVDNAPLHALAAGVDGPNGVYTYDATPGVSSFPGTSNGQSPFYWVDVVYSPTTTVPTAPSAPTNLAAVANSATQVALTWSASTGTVTAYHVERSTDGVNFTQIAGSVQGTSYTDTTAVANTTYTYRVRAENSGQFSAYATASPVTTPAAPPATSIFSSTTIPAAAQQNVNDPTITAKGGVELGMKFRSDTAGTITGVRFWKGTQNTGTHTGELWSSTGQLLATATFTNETASGWQQVNFSSPVSIAANTTYIVAYHTTAPYIAYTGGKFTSAGVDNAPLHALANGVDGNNGVYSYDVTPGTSNFPSAFNGQSPFYWVDVVYSPATAPAAPSAPTNLAATVGSPTQVNLTWTASTGTVTAYHVERSTDGVNFTEIAGSVQGTSYTDSTASANTAYTYRVRAENSGQFSGYSNTQQVTTPASPAAPSAPTNLTAVASSSTQVALNWTASTGTVTAYHVERSTDGVNFTEIAGSVQTTSYTDTTAAAGTTYTYRVRAENSGSFSGYATAAPLTTAQPAAGSFTSADINSPVAGSTNEITPGRSYDVTGGGADIGYLAQDQFRYTYEQLTGNFDAVVQVQSMTSPQATAKAGLMVRSTLDAGSPMVFSGATTTSGYRFLSRATANTVAAYANTGSVTYPNVWVRLVRSGNVFTGYQSTDGINWTQTGTSTVALPTTLYFGLAVSGHSTTTTATAQFRGLSVH